MSTFGEKFVFTFLGAITAVIISLTLFSDAHRKQERTPASQLQIESVYFYYFD